MEENLIKDELIALQNKIISLAWDFEEKTGLKVDSMDIIRNSNSKYCGPSEMIETVVVKITL